MQRSHNNKVHYTVYTLDSSLIPRLFGGGPKEPGYKASLTAVRMSQHPKAFHYTRHNYVMLHYVMLCYDHYTIAHRAIVAEA